MITIIHGDDIVRSRNYFTELKNGQKNATSYEGNRVTLTDITQDIEGSGLFNDSKAVFIEDFLTKNKKSDKSTKEILTFIFKNGKSSDFILWESKEVSKKDLFIFKDALIKGFKLPSSIFIFLDNLRPGNSKLLLNLFYDLTEGGTSEELILFMLQRQFRILLSLSDPSISANIDEITRLAPWQKSKLEKQASLFKNPAKLKIIYKELYKIEFKRKTGTLPLSLAQSIDFLLLKI